MLAGAFLLSRWMAPSAPSEETPPPAPAPVAATPELLQARCGSCHPVDAPGTLAREDWARVMSRMRKLIPEMTGTGFPEEEMSAIEAWYIEKSPATLAALPPDPAGSPIEFKRQTLPVPDTRLPGELPVVLNVNPVDLDGDGSLDVVVCDGRRGTLSIIHREEDKWLETAIGQVGIAARTEAVDWNKDGQLDLLVSILGSPVPTDKPVGRLMLLTSTGNRKFIPRTIMDRVGRLADARPGDFDGDGDVDFVVAEFGHLKRGRIGWMKQKTPKRFDFHVIREGPGAIHVPPCDLNGDGALDFVAVISQHVEQVAAFINDGSGDFEEHVLYQADTPLFGSSGIELVDLDKDGDLDVLYTNGDVFDLEDPAPSTFLRPYHGVQWLENKGDLNFEYHDLIRFYGAYRATAGDLDGDGDLDVVATSIVNDWNDPARRSLIWLENDGKQSFTPHGIASSPTELVTAALADLDGDGRLDIVAGGMHVPPTTNRVGRVTLWRNLGGK